MSNLFRSTVIKGNRLTDFSNTSATVGNPIPFGYGKFPVDANIVFAALPPKEHVTRRRQGKGGVKSETYTYTMSYAVAFARGPIYKYLWIKRNGKVVYTTDPNAPVEDQAYAAKWLGKATLYYGRSNQLPDSTIESVRGSGQVSAMRDLAYAVLEDDDVTDTSGAVPNYEACVVRGAARSYTTPPYPVFFVDNVQDSIRMGNVSSMQMPFDETETSVIMMDATRRLILQKYVNYVPESIDIEVTMRDATRKSVLLQYTYYPPSAIDATMTMRDATRKTVVMNYLNYVPESIDIEVTMRDATRTPV